VKNIAVVTTSRADYGIYLPILRRIKSDATLRLRLIAGGTHLSQEHGLTIKAIEEDGFEINDRIDVFESDDSPQGIAISIGQSVVEFSKVFAREIPDILVVVGDRYEMLAAALAALPFKIPVAHIHGGEITRGAIDDALRHSMTKLSHLHFVATDSYARRVVQLGEEPWRVTVSGAPSLDILDTIDLLPKPGIERLLGFSLSRAPVLVTFHPVTLEYEQTEWQLSNLFNALEEQSESVIFTAPNADTTGRKVSVMMKEYVGKHPRSRFVENLGTQAYFSLMNMASLMVGNSSSGIIEAPSFKLPVVNIGTRQQGRVRARNIIDVGYTTIEIKNGIKMASSPAWRRGLQGMENPYKKPGAAETVVQVLRSTELDERLIVKRFHDLGVIEESCSMAEIVS